MQSEDPSPEPGVTAAAAAPPTRWRRVLLKLSGEAFAGDQGFGLCSDTIASIASGVKDARDLGVEIAIVVGGGNIVRGQQLAVTGADRATADNMGMLATVINSLALQIALESIGVFTRVQTAIDMAKVAEPYVRRRAIRHLEKGRVVILAAGTGNPYFTTDTAAALRAIEIEAEAVLKATNVDGVYDSDPRKNPHAVRYKTLEFSEAIAQNLGVMDMTAFTLCQENKLPIVVFGISQPGAIRDVLLDDRIGTYVGGSGN